MKNQFVPYPIALALKELGFDEKCFYAWCQVRGGYTETGGDKWLDEYKMRANGNPFGDFSEGVDYNNITGNNKNRIQCSSPLYQQVEQWFREKKQIIIAVHAYRDLDAIDEVDQTLWDFTLWDKEWNDTSDYTYYHSYEEAREAAISEAIKIVKGEKNG